MSRATTASPLRVRTISEPEGELVSIEDCRGHLEFPYYGDSEVDPVDDAKILDKLRAAREFCEDFTGQYLARRTVEVAMDSFPTGAVEIPFYPVVTVETFQAAGEDIDAEAYVLDDFSKPARLVPVSGWPSVTAATNTIRLRCAAGYTDDTDGLTLPYAIRAAMLLVLAHLWENREDSTEKAMQSIPNGALSLLRPHRIRLGMA